MPPKDKKAFVKGALGAAPTIEEIVAEQAAKQAAIEQQINEEVRQVEGVVPSFDFILVVRNPFLSYRKGDRIVTTEEIQAVIDAGYLHHCCKTKI